MVTFHIIPATLEHLDLIYNFVDYWLTGGGFKDNAPGVVHDCFVTPSMHKKYITTYTTTLLFHQTTLIGWAVVQKNGSLIHLLIHGAYRHQGSGSLLLNHIKPQRIRSKSDQSSGDPAPFYQKHGYTKTDTIQSRSCVNIDQLKPKRPKNIDIYERL